MNNWNDGYKYRNNNSYGNYGVYEGKYDTAILWIILVIIVLGGGAMLFHHLLKFYEPGQIIGVSVATVVLSCIASSIVYTAYVYFMEWWNGLWPRFTIDDQNTTPIVNNSRNTSYLTPKKPSVYKWNRNTETADIPAGLIAGDRTKPPSAVFFCRLDGHERTSLGMLEEKYLNTWEKKYWDKQKAKDPALATASESVNPQPGLEGIETTTKIVKW